MDWFMQYANNLSDGLFWFLIPLTIIAIIVGVSSWIRRDYGTGLPYGSDLYANATWRMLTSAQGGVAMWIIWSMINAVPSPDYQTKVVEKVVTRDVSLAHTFNDVYKTCYRQKATTNEQCEARAILLTKPNAIYRVTVKVPEKVYVPDPYQSLVDRCQRAFKVTGRNTDWLNSNIEERMDDCHERAMAVRRNLIE